MSAARNVYSRKHASPFEGVLSRAPPPPSHPLLSEPPLPRLRISTSRRRFSTRRDENATKTEADSTRGHVASRVFLVRDYVYATRLSGSSNAPRKHGHSVLHNSQTVKAAPLNLAISREGEGRDE